MPPEVPRGDRYPGGRPFADTDLDRRLFFGREIETGELANQIIASSLLVVFGKSGMGKSSLLQAGVFPKLRQHQLLPLLIRLNQPDRSLMDDFLVDIAEQSRSKAFDHTPGETGSLWEYFKTSAFWCDGELQTPVLVIDQGEEIFTLRPPAVRKRIAEELGQLLRSGLPASIRERRERGEEISYSEKPPQLKVIISLREDYLGHLEELSTELPQILEKRFRLTPLQRDAARRAVVEPAALPQGAEFTTPPFTYTDAAVDEILSFLTGADRQIEPFQLQVLCHHVERKVAAAAGTAPFVVQPGLLGGKAGMEKILGQFYHAAIRRVRGRRQRKHARTLCEDGLLDEGGRRASLEEAQIRRTFRVTSTTLDTLVDSRVLRKEPRLGSFYYEVSHDSLAAPLLRSRRWNMPRRYRRGLVWAVCGTAATVLFGLVFLGAIGFALIEEEKTRKRTEDMLGEILWPLAKLGEVGQNELLETVYEKVITTYEDMGTQDITDTGFNNRGLVYQTRAGLRGSRWELMEARADFESAAQHFRAAANVDPGSSAYRRNIALAEQGFADIARKQGRHAEALVHYDLTIAAAEEAVSLAPKEEKASDSVPVLAETYLAVAELRADRGELTQAAAALEQSRKRYLELAATEPTDAGWQSSLFWVLIESGRQLSDRGNHFGAREEYERAKQLAAVAYEQDPDDAYVRQNLIAAEDRIGESALALGDYRRAVELSELNWQSQTKLFEDHPSRNIENSVGFAQSRLADALSLGVLSFNALRPLGAATLDNAAREALVAAIGHYKASLAFIQRIQNEVGGTTQLELYLAYAERSLGDGYAAIGDNPAALAHYAEARKKLQKLLEDDPENGTLQFCTAQVGVEAARVQLASRGPAGIPEVLQEVRATQEKLVGREPDNTNWQTTLADIHEMLGDAAAASSNGVTAQEAYAKAHDIRHRLRQASPQHVGWALQDAVTLCKRAKVHADPSGDDVREARQILRRLDDVNQVGPLANRVVDILLTKCGAAS